MNTRICKNCGSPLSEAAKFCNRCGAPADSTPLAPVPPQPEYQESGQLIGTTPQYDYRHQEAAYKQPVPTELEVVEERKHGGCLGAFLALAIFGNLVFGILILIGSGELGGIFLLSALLNFAGAGFAFAIWKWQKWGVYGYIGVIGITSLINLGTENYVAAAQGIVPILILIGLTRQVWDHLE